MSSSIKAVFSNWTNLTLSPFTTFPAFGNSPWTKRINLQPSTLQPNSIVVSIMSKFKMFKFWLWPLIMNAPFHGCSTYLNLVLFLSPPSQFVHRLPIGFISFATLLFETLWMRSMPYMVTLHFLQMLTARFLARFGLSLFWPSFKNPIVISNIV